MQQTIVKTLEKLNQILPYMIEKLQNNDIEVSKKIRLVFQLSYKIEAKLLNATDFPTLKRSIENFVNSSTAFF